MKKTHKKIFGLFGLVLVVAVTIFAAFLPAPKTQAADTTPVTDTISVRVVGSTPVVNLSGIAPGAVVTSGSQEVSITYENIENLLAVLKFTDVNGNVYEKTLIDSSIGDKPVSYVAGTSDISLDLANGTYSYTYQYYVDGGGTATATGGGDLLGYGYGQYVLTASGDSIEGVPAESSVNFSYVPVTASVTQDGSKVSIDLDYDETGGTGTGQVDKVVINIYDENGNPVGPSPVTMTPLNANYTFDMSDYGLPSGTYTVSVQAYDVNGVKLYKPFEVQFYYEARRTPVPDTGGIMGDLNISKTDYIITGLIIFSVVGISGAVFISRHDKKTGNRRK